MGRGSLQLPRQAPSCSQHDMRHWLCQAVGKGRDAFC